MGIAGTKMAATRRVSKTLVDWSAFRERVPPRQTEQFRAFKARNDYYVNRVHAYPAELPKIDFDFYKSRITNTAMVDQFKKLYESMSVAYPMDKRHVHRDIDEEQKAAEASSKAYIAERQQEINDAKLVLAKIDTIPKAEDMTYEMYAYYFPDKALDQVKRPTFWPHIPMIQPGHKDSKLL